MTNQKDLARVEMSIYVEYNPQSVANAQALNEYITGGGVHLINQCVKSTSNEVLEQIQNHFGDFKFDIVEFKGAPMFHLSIPFSYAYPNQSKQQGYKGYRENYIVNIAKTLISMYKELFSNDLVNIKVRMATEMTEDINLSQIHTAYHKPVLNMNKA